MGRTKPQTKSKSKSLKSGRPPLLPSSASSSATTTATKATSSASLSSKHTRTLINRHHQLQKRLALARAQNDTAQIAALEAQLAAQGGLKSYQLASQRGQSADRGGDSSRVLVHWLKREIDARRTTATNEPALRILEIGALSTTNALNVRGATVVRRIDLRSSTKGVEEADFMRLPLPDDPTGQGLWEGGLGYDVLSLSLVLNYVPDAKGRGAMLRRTTWFFSSPPDGRGGDGRDGDGDEDEGEAEGGGGEHHPSLRRAETRKMLPCLFLVLPAPTLHNSRYLTPTHLDAILSSLGYAHLETKTTRKLHYSLWRYDARRRAEWRQGGKETVFRKKEINPGGGRNNFCIVLDENEGD